MLILDLTFIGNGDSPVADPGILEPGGARSRHGIIFEVWRLFVCPFTHTLCFVLRVENKMHIVNTACRLQYRLCVFCSQNFQKSAIAPYMKQTILKRNEKQHAIDQS